MELREKSGREAFAKKYLKLLLSHLSDLAEIRRIRHTSVAAEARLPATVRIYAFP